jgi:hypothetical protein
MTRFNCKAAKRYRVAAGFKIEHVALARQVCNGGQCCGHVIILCGR